MLSFLYRTIELIMHIRRSFYRKIGLLPPNNLPSIPPATTPTEEILTEKKKLMLEMMQMLHIFFEQYHLRYHLAYGNAIGAIRHHGFIPWDDDIDILMPLEDYLRFEKLWSHYGDHKNYFLQTKFNDPNLIGITPRLRKNGTTSMDPIGYNLPMHWGVPIDIMIWFHCPKNHYATIFMQWNYNQCSKYGSRISQNYYAPKILKQYWLILTFLFFTLLRCMNFFCHHSGLITDFFIPQPLSESSIFPCKPAPYEDYTFLLPKDCDLFLRKCYGDYLTPPPVEERKIHPYAILDLKHDFSEFVTYDTSYLKRETSMN